MSQGTAAGSVDSLACPSGPIAVFGAAEVVKTVRTAAHSKQYRDDAVLATLKLLDVAGALT